MIELNAINERSGYDGVRTYLSLQAEHPARVFMPNKPQADLIRAIGTHTPKKRIYLVTSANGTGKTTVAFNIIQNIAYPGLNAFKEARDVQTGEQFPGFFNYPLFNNFPSDWPKSCWYVSNKDALKAIEKKLKVWIDPKTAATIKHEGQRITKMSFPGTDWDIEFKTVEQDPQTFETADISVVIFDEPPPYRLFTAAVTRLRGGGIIIIPATPLFTAAWFVDEIIEKIADDSEEGKDMHHATVNVWTNCIEKAGEWDLGPFGIQKKGNLWEENINFMIRHWDPDELEARRDGVFKYLTGLVYKTYDRALHFLKEVPRVPAFPKHYMYRMIIDPHDRRPPAVVWTQIDAYMRRRIIREWPSIHDTQYHHLPFHKIRSADPYVIRDFIRFFAEIEQDLNIPQDRIRRIMDPFFGRKQIRAWKSNRTVHEEYAFAAREEIGQEWSWHLDYDDTDLASGHKAVKELLKTTSDGDQRLIISPNCTNVDYAMRHYSYEELEGRQLEKREISDKVTEIGKDFADLVRYDAMVPFNYEELNIERDRYEPADYGEKERGVDSKIHREAEPDWREKFKSATRPGGSRGA